MPQSKYFAGSTRAPLRWRHVLRREDAQTSFSSVAIAATDKSKLIVLFDICISQEFGPPFFVFLACDLASGISSLEGLKRRLHETVASPLYRHKEAKEQHPDEDPPNPPIRVHAPVVIHRHPLTTTMPDYAIQLWLAGLTLYQHCGDWRPIHSSRCRTSRSAQPDRPHLLPVTRNHGVPIELMQ